ncbi:MAG: hypothetical protein NWE96_03370 [Candidatus Bathyarchaeota archaeon]|nr:hypothetical protein [Candidatus Bathyarchaeota archaeon]
MKNLKTNKQALSKMLIVAVLVAVIVVAAVAAYWYMSQNPAAPPADSTTPTQTPGTSASVSPSATGTTTTGVSGANSLQFKVRLTENGQVKGTYTYMGKSIGTDNFSMRIEYTDADGDYIYIFNGATKKAWTYDKEWVDISDYYASQWSIWDNLWKGYTTSLASWAGTGDYTYTDGTTTVRIYDISINPTLDDSLFVHT